MLVVVQRYGDGVAGGAEAHARELVRHLRPHVDIEVATTTALDYRTWEHVLIPGEDRVDGVTVRRFQVVRRRARDFRRYERAAFADGHSLADESAFVEAQGPCAPELLEFIGRRGREYAAVVFFTYLYYPTAFGLPLAPERAVLVPTAHDEPALRLSLYRPVFCAPRAIAYNTEEERALVQRRFANARVPSEVAGVGVDVPGDVRPQRFRERHGVEGPFFLYVGRIVESKGCGELFAHWARRRAVSSTAATLVLAGQAEMPIPDREDVRSLGPLTEGDKFDAYAACTALVMPSRLESLSLVTLEAWAVGRPVICPSRSPVLTGMSARSGGGLAYGSFAEFAEICELLVERPPLVSRLGASGAAFVAATYTWPRVVETYLDLFAEVRARLS